MIRTLKSHILSAAVLLALAIPGTIPAATVYTTVFSGANEVPPSGSAGIGNATVTLDGNMLTVDEVFSGLTVPASAAHIHCCGAVGVNEPVAVPFTGFPNLMSSTYDHIFDLTMLSTYTSAFVMAEGGTAASAEAALIAGLNGGQTYLNIHNAKFPGGEIRGQLAAVPEPGTAGLLLFALLPAIGALRKNFRT